MKHDQLHSELSRDHLITRKQLRRLLPVSVMTIRRWERDGLLPKHFTIGRTSFWRDRNPAIPSGAQMNSPVGQINLVTPLDSERETLLFSRYQSALAVAVESGTVCDAQIALDAWEDWLSVNQPNDSSRAAIPTPRLLVKILHPEAKSS